MNLIDSIATELGIQRIYDESDQSYASRIVLSGLSRWMLTAFFSKPGKTSVETVKAIANEKLSFFRETMTIGPVSALDAGESKDIIDYIYKILLENGAFYHKAYYVVPRMRQLIPLGQASIIQGMQPEERCAFSGLAPISMVVDGECDLPAEFDLPEQTMDDIVSLVWKRSSPIESSVYIGEYLKFDRIQNGYYSAKRLDSYSITMGRTAHAGVGYEHYIINEHEVRRVPDKLIECGYGEYCRLAIINKMTQQTVHAELNPFAVKLKFDYKLPVNDLRFLRFVAWPTSLSNLENPFEFVVHSKVWPCIKKRLQNLNYKVVQL